MFRVFQRWRSRLSRAALVALAWAGSGISDLAAAETESEFAAPRVSLNPNQEVLVAPHVINVRAPDIPETYPRAASTMLEAQIALARRGYSCGSIDGVRGAQTERALRAFQAEEELPVSGTLDEATAERLVLETAPLTRVELTADDLARLRPVGTTWLAKSEQPALEFETALELVAERTRAHPNLIRQLNAAVDWDQVVAGTWLTAPALERIRPGSRAAGVHVALGEHTLRVVDADGKLVAFFPVSIAREVEKRPVGELHITVAAANPNYTFNPAVFPESPEAQELGRKLMIAPGPNNPVGLAWIGLDRVGYGIHGTPHPEQIGRTESHGCFRLANWDALTLLDLVWVGMPVFVDP